VKVDRSTEPPENAKHKILFENLTPLHPTDSPQARARDQSEENLTGRIIDIIAPIGKGQRGLIVAPPKAGKTVMLQHIAHSPSPRTIPTVMLIVLLIDERPEEVTEMQRR
jgi:transcription termination factor Rho